ncbi:formate dehydrogenase subunit alpha [Vibrio tapetis subsp. quintayensis]|uniref:formate dehydrogenase subunit alpha n=1 Tax=Vibrio tapetis TaxID=52443 RepID=UPI0025B3A305|nr:formate dehydrogenase subunit alpha [Vibrio tapetis]MDN3682894.1 formate dehydrogenase subunit alpha [Vibrio tapetis subsp. quintayensis]
MKVTFNGHDYTVDQSQSILSAAESVGVEIPTLCGYSQQEEKQPCDICVVEVCGKGQVRACETKLEAGMNVTTQSPALSEHRQHALSKILSDHNADCEAPCQVACPAHVDIQSYLFSIAQNEHQQAVGVIKKTLPMPISVGRVCPAFCEAECRRGLVDDSIAIRHVKRHAADIDIEMATPITPEKKPTNGKKVAIVGAGPGGLTCGYYLSYAGFEVTVLESMPKAGGWLQYGIPEYRLPKALLDREIAHMCKGGMKVECNKEVGRDYSLTSLKQDYDAVVLAVGASKAVTARYTGSDLAGCYLGVDYLKDYLTDQTYVTGKKVAVIGGGNTAIDCARTAVRDGADTTIVYRRTLAEMPAEDHEIHAAQEEGVNFVFLTNPVENIADDNGQVSIVKCEKMKLGEPSESGRRRPEPTGEFVELEFDTVISALSQEPDTAFMHGHEESLPLNRWGTAESDESSMHHGDNVFSIGDFRRGPATAIEAIADAKIAADAIEGLLINGKMVTRKAQFNSHKAAKLSMVSAKEYRNETVARRLKFPQLSQQGCVSTFEEVEQDSSTESVIAEAARCLECGCQANTDCSLRDFATEYDVTNDKLENEDKQIFCVDKSSEFIVFDANRCISCGSCVQACRDEGVHDVLQFNSEGNRPHCGDGESMGDSDCVQCGACIQACPVGALVDKRDKSQGRVDMLKPVKTICTYCGVGCRVVMYVDEASNKVRYVTGDTTSPVNHGMLCVKGRFGFDFVQSEERLSTPLIRKDGKLQPASWDEAISLIGEKFSHIREEFGGNALAGFSSAKTTNEDNYVFQKLIRREFGTNNVDHCARLCHSTTVTGLEASIGSGAMTNDIPSIKHSDVIFVIGSDTTAAHPIIASHLKQAIKHGGARLIVADPKRIDMADHAQLYVAQRPGTDVMLLNGIMHQILKNGWQDQSYIERRTEGFDEVTAELLKEDYSAEKVELITGVAADDIKQIAKTIGTAGITAVYYSMGITQHTTGHDNVRSIANLQMMCGNLGVEGGGINPLRGQSNVQGACDMGALPTDYPGYQKVVEPEHHAKFVKAWNAPHLSKEKGLTLTEIIDGACDRSVRGLFVMGENPVLSDPDQKHVIHGLESLDFLVVQDIFLTETAEFADVVLPSYSFAEKSGHFTNTERRVQRLNPAIKAPGIAREDWRIIQDIAHAMGADWDYQSVEQITQEITEVTPQYQAITWDRIGSEGLQWPCNDANPNGTRIMHQTEFKRGLGEFAVVPFKYAAELPDDEYPMVLTTGRLLEQFHTGTMTRKTKGLDNLAGPRIMISVFDAERLGIHNGQNIRLASRRGEIEAPAFVTKRMQKGVVFVPFHFAESPANRLTTTATDPYAKIPEFKVAAVRVEVPKVNDISEKELAGVV